MEMKLMDKQTVCWYSALSLKPKLQDKVTEIRRKIQKNIILETGGNTFKQS